MSDGQDFSHGPGEDVIDPAAPFIGWLALCLLALMAVFAVVVLSAAFFG
jgi:hypothetical protein